MPPGHRYWHRSLNPKKLIEVKFSQLSRNMTMQRTLKLHRLPAETETEGFRRLTPDDVPKAMELLNDVGTTRLGWCWVMWVELLGWNWC